jgi:hypothetical protein
MRASFGFHGEGPVTIMQSRFILAMLITKYSQRCILHFEETCLLRDPPVDPLAPASS